MKGFPEVKKPTLTVDMVGDEVGFMCQFTRLTTFGVQYFLTYYSDQKVLSGPHDVINATLILTESLTYGSQVGIHNVILAMLIFWNTDVVQT